MSCHSFLLDFLFFYHFTLSFFRILPILSLGLVLVIVSYLCLLLLLLFCLFTSFFLFTFLSDLIRQVSFLFFIIAVGRSLGLFVHCLEAVWVMEQMKQWQNSGNELLVPEIGFNYEGEDSSGESDTSSATTTDYVLPPR